MEQPKDRKARKERFRVEHEIDRSWLGRMSMHPTKEAVIWTMAEEGRPIGPIELSKLIDEPLGNISYHAKKLEEAKIIELVRTEPRRGAVAHFYSLAPGVVISLSALTTARKVLAGDDPAPAMLSKIAKILGVDPPPSVA